MSVFAPDAVAEWLRSGLFWAGVISFFVGVVAAAWHFTAGGWLARHVWWRLRMHPPVLLSTERDVVKDNALADRIDELAKELFDQHAVGKRLATERAWERSNPAMTWEQQKAKIKQYAEEEETITRRFLIRIEKVCAEAKRRMVNVDVWGTDRLGNEDLATWARGLILLASSLRDGDYIGKTLLILHHTQAMGTLDEIQAAQNGRLVLRGVRPEMLKEKADLAEPEK